MAKLICKKCSKIFSDVSAFCPKCGAPAEISGRPEFIGGRQMAMAGRSSRGRSAAGTFDGKSFDSSLSDDSGLTHSHSSFDDICSDDDESPLERIKNASEKVRSAGNFTKNMTFSSPSVSFRRNRRSAGTGSVTRGKVIAVIVAVIIGINILSAIITGITGRVLNVAGSFENIGFEGAGFGREQEVYPYEEEVFVMNEDANGFMEIVAAQLDYRNYSIDTDAVEAFDEEQHIRFFSTLIKEELSILEPYMNAELSDDEYFNYLCSNYIEGLNYQIQALDYYSFDFSAFEYDWNLGYEMRLSSIIELYEMYGMPLDDELYNIYRADYDGINSVGEFKAPADLLTA